MAFFSRETEESKTTYLLDCLAGDQQLFTLCPHLRKGGAGSGGKKSRAMAQWDSLSCMCKARGLILNTRKGVGGVGDDINIIIRKIIMVTEDEQYADRIYTIFSVFISV